MTVLTTVHWNQFYGTLTKVKYHDGRFVMEEQGLYYVYAKTCFRYSFNHDTKKQDVSNLQLFQYIFHESHTQSKLKPVQLSKSGGTFNWSERSNNMYCVQQGRSVRLGQSDGLFVNVSNSWLLDPEPEGTYFGAFKISTWLLFIFATELVYAHFFTTLWTISTWPRTTEHLYFRSLTSDFFFQYWFILYSIKGTSDFLTVNVFL